MQCNIQLAPSERAEGKPACMYWRSIPISDHAIVRMPPAMPPLEEGPTPSYPSWTSEHAAALVWAVEGYLQVKRPVHTIMVVQQERNQSHKFAVQQCHAQYKYCEALLLLSHMPCDARIMSSRHLFSMPHYTNSHQTHVTGAAKHVSLLRPHKCLAMKVGSIGNKP